MLFRSIKLNFNHPVKELVWVVQPDSNVDLSSTKNYGGPQHFNYTDSLDATYYTGVTSNPFVSDGDEEVTPEATDWLASIQAISGISGDAGCSSGLVYDHGSNPVVSAKLQLNGQDRFSEREGSYFDTVQPFQHHTRSPDTGINVYSFALRPEEHQPSGSCNFSRIDNAVLQLVLSSRTVSGVKTAKVRVYAKNYNVVRVMSGMAGVAYSN